MAGWWSTFGPPPPKNTHHPKHGEAAARLVASGDCRFGITLCGTGQGIMLPADAVGIAGECVGSAPGQRHHPTPQVTGFSHRRKRPAPSVFCCRALCAI
nr:RpiB/LacA/LacB family sugar-phosphate isomerase [Nitratireductor soli]